MTTKQHIAQWNWIRSICLPFVFCLISTFVKAQDTLVSENDTNVQEFIIPANELYQNTWSTEHVRLSKIAHSDTTELELITHETPAFSMPVRDGIVISKYGKRGKNMHTGIDLKQGQQDRIFAVFDGIIRMAKNYSGYGNVIVIRHPNGLETVYAHLSNIVVKPLQMVKAGDWIGLSGRTGRATTEHLHFEIRFLYEPFDPNLLIDFENQCLRHDQIRFINDTLITE